MPTNSIAPTGLATDGTFDSGAKAVTDATQWYPVCLIQARGRKVVLSGFVGAGAALTGFKITKAAQVGGSHMTLAVNSDFTAPPNSEIGSVLGTPQSAAASAQFEITLIGGGAEYAIYAQSAGATTLEIAGTVSLLPFGGY